jgi:hypothetical protein
MRAFNHLALPAQQSAAVLHQSRNGYAHQPFSTYPVGRIANRDCDEAKDWGYILGCYLAGWNEVDPDKIVAATAPDYCFDDPLVGQFSKKSLPIYFRHLHARFVPTGAPGGREYTFCFHGPIDDPPHRGERHYIREAPALGLTGVTTITIGERGVVAERVAYDLNLASDVLRRQQAHEHAGQPHLQAEVSRPVP